MQSRSETKTFTVPLGLEAHTIAEQFHRKHSNRDKAKQVYINTLAVSAVKFYLRCMGWNTDFQASFSYNPVMQSLMDVADLQVVGLGKLECFAVFPPAPSVYIPPEACSERIGYVAVQLSESLREATLLGFVKTVTVDGEIPLNELRSLEELLLHLHQIKQSETVKARVNLSKWFENLFETSWQSTEVIFALMDQKKLAYRSTPSGNASVARAKLIDMGLQLGNQSVALLVALAPFYEQKVEISVQLHPVEGETYLPPSLKMSLLSETGEIFQEVQSRSHDNYIQLKRFRGSPGESFSIRVALGDVIIIENFVI